MSEQEPLQSKAGGAKALSRYLRDGISTGVLGVGIKLPAERELSHRFGASRGAVRRVLAGFRERGLITQAVGSGTFVAQASAQTAASLSEPAGSSSMDGNVSPAELMVARRLIEPLMPGLIVRNATAADFARMQHCIEQSEAAKSIEDFEHWDGALHTTLAVATHNVFFVRILELTQRVRDQGEWGRLKARSLTGHRRAQYEQQHRVLVDALRDRDAEAARRLLIQHLDQIQQNLFGD
ncbi:MAG: FadR/GntR family transcriptional regulator [Janthinobacterium lividum]